MPTKRCKRSTKPSTPALTTSRPSRGRYASLGQPLWRVPGKAEGGWRMPSGSESAIELAREVWTPYEQAIQRFEEAWERGDRPALDDYLAVGVSHPRAALVEFVHTDLEFRLKAG